MMEEHRLDLGLPSHNNIVMIVESQDIFMFQHMTKTREVYLIYEVNFTSSNSELENHTLLLHFLDALVLNSPHIESELQTRKEWCSNFGVCFLNPHEQHRLSLKN
jgi:hypothetical protein